MRTHDYFHHWGEILVDDFLYDVPLAYPPRRRRIWSFEGLKKYRFPEEIFTKNCRPKGGIFLCDFG